MKSKFLKLIVLVGALLCVVSLSSCRELEEAFPSVFAKTVKLDGFNLELQEDSYKVVSGEGETVSAVQIPAAYNGIPVTSIGGSAFAGCTGLTSIEIPDSVTSIDYSAFWGCTGLTSIEIPASVTSIGNSAFWGCTGLASITIQDIITTTYSNAFFGCTGLTEVHISDISAWCNTDFGRDINSHPLNYANLYLNGSLITELEIPEGVTKISPYAFYNQYSITSVTIPDSVTSIRRGAFENCTSLTEVHISDISAWCNTDFVGDINSHPLNYANLYLNGSLITELEIPEGVTKISPYAFYNQYSITSVTIPDSVTSIGWGAFENCTSLTEVHISDISAWCNTDFGQHYANPLYVADNETLYLNDSPITKLEVPEGVTEISDFAFCGLSSITGVTIPNSVTSIGDSAFSDCTGLTSLFIPSSVINIDKYAFFKCAGLTSIIFAENSRLESIGDRAFAWCTELTSIEIPDSLIRIGECALTLCENLKYKKYDNAYYLGNENNPYLVLLGAMSAFVTTCEINSNTKVVADEAFIQCQRLTSITIPKSVTSIGNSAFKDCVKLRTVTFEDNGNLEIIGDSAFRSCLELRSIEIPESVTSIGYDTFGNCRVLENITIPDSVTNIGILAFWDCTGLTSIEIPASVTSIGDSAFMGCFWLTTINYNGTKAEWRAIEKSYKWHVDIRTDIVHCTDGDVIISES